MKETVDMKIEIINKLERIAELMLVLILIITAVPVSTPAEETDTDVESGQEMEKDNINPEITVSIDGTLHPEAKEGYYNNIRIATITVTDSEDGFDEQAIYDGIVLSAKNAAGEDVAVSKDTMLSSWTHDGDVHTATLTFSENANYEWSISYINKDGESNSDVTTKGDSVFKFTVDKNEAPAATISMETTTWNKLIDTLTFGFFKSYIVTASAVGEDITSPVQDILYYKSNDTKVLSKSELEALFADEKFVKTPSSADADEQCVIYARVTDYAGNTAYVSTSGVIIDTAKPILTLTTGETNENGFYNMDVNVKIEVDEANLERDIYSGIKSIDYKIIKDGDALNPTQQGVLYSFSKSNPSKSDLLKSWTGSIVVNSAINNSNDVLIVVGAIDNAGNYSEAKTRIKIDITSPIINVSYDNNSVQNGNYYNEDRTATIQITERNFNADRVKIDLSATNGETNAPIPSVSGWTHSGDIHTATISYSSDARYTFGISASDSAGNAAAQFESQSFYVDKTAPALEISGVENNSANNGKVAPVITYSDTNYDSSTVSINLTGVKRGDVKLKGIYTEQHNGSSFTFDNFEEIKDVDDIYTLTVSLTDKAGNTTHKSITFSVNRFGSSYVLDNTTKSINGTYVTNPQDIVIVETNADKLSDVRVTLFRNNEIIELEEGKDYEVKLEGGNGQWYKYTYTIFESNFENDAVNRVTIHSKDAAGSIAENTLDTKTSNIEFGVDKTPPTINVKNLENGATYLTENLTVNFSASDNLKLSSVIMYMDNYEKPYKNWTGDELEAVVGAGGEFSFDIQGDSKSAHNIKIIALDAAGNKYTCEVKDFYVTTDLFIRYYNNKPLFYGSIIGCAAAAALVVAVVVVRRKRKARA